MHYFSPTQFIFKYLYHCWIASKYFYKCWNFEYKFVVDVQPDFNELSLPLLSSLAHILMGQPVDIQVLTELAKVQSLGTWAPWSFTKAKSKWVWMTWTLNRVWKIADEMSILIRGDLSNDRFQFRGGREENQDMAYHQLLLQCWSQQRWFLDEMIQWSPCCLTWKN